MVRATGQVRRPRVEAPRSAEAAQGSHLEDGGAAVLFGSNCSPPRAGTVELGVEATGRAVAATATTATVSATAESASSRSSTSATASTAAEKMAAACPATTQTGGAITQTGGAASTCRVGVGRLCRRRRPHSRSRHPRPRCPYPHPFSCLRPYPRPCARLHPYPRFCSRLRPNPYLRPSPRLRHTMTGVGFGVPIG